MGDATESPMFISSTQYDQVQDSGSWDTIRHLQTLVNDVNNENRAISHQVSQLTADYENSIADIKQQEDVRVQGYAEANAQLQCDL